MDTVFIFSIVKNDYNKLRIFKKYRCLGIYKHILRGMDVGLISEFI